MSFLPKGERKPIFVGALTGLLCLWLGDEALGGRLWVLFPVLTLLAGMASGFLGLAHLVCAAPELKLGSSPQSVALAIRWCGAAALYNLMATVFIGSVRQGVIGEIMVALWATVSIIALLTTMRAVRALHRLTGEREKNHP